MALTFPTRPLHRIAAHFSTRRAQRGAVMPSPVVLLSIVALTLAAVAFVVTRGDEPTEREIPAASDGPSKGSDPSASGDPSDAADPTNTPTDEPTKKPKPEVKRDQVGVVVFNNTSISGLAGTVGEKVTEAGWKFVAADNWYGTVVGTTVYFPQGMRAAARLLALDLGIQRVVPADPAGDMSTTNLTVILTGALD